MASFNGKKKDSIEVQQATDGIIVRTENGRVAISVEETSTGVFSISLQHGQVTSPQAVAGRNLRIYVLPE